MITKIVIDDVATFTIPSEVIPRRINYIYGGNGSGKTTISRLIANHAIYPNCEIAWSGKNLPAIVYNKDFVKENFEQDTLKGIFTLGKDVPDAEDRIKRLLKEIEAKEKIVSDIEKAIQQLNERFDEQTNSYIDICWDSKIKYSEELKKCLTGFLSNKRNYFDKCIAEQNKSEDLLDFLSLSEKYKQLYHTTIEEIDSLPEFHFEEIQDLETDSIFSEVIIGSENNQVAELISHLKNSDWVDEGRSYFAKTKERKCPYCQQSIGTEIEEQIEAYFDESFQEKSTSLDLAISKYTQYVERFIKYIEDIIEIEISVFDFTEVTNNLGLLKKTFEKNILSLQKKRTQKSKSVELESLHKVFDLITSQISECSTEIESHNSRCQNIEDERRKLTSQVWRFIASETKSTIDEYIKAKEKYESGIQSQDTKKNKTNLEISALNREITTIQSEITSVAHSINEINRILMGFHFEGFYLSESTRKGHYELIRKDGTSATNTLSEGEYTFITFLYFYYLIRGSSEKEQLEQKKIVVIDDPISSLDSSVLFIVSNLVKALIDELNDNYRGSKIRQLFVLTHNIYFHKEISFKGSRGNITRNELFWLVYKKEEISEIKTSTKNPINTTYALLWDEIKNSESTNRITVFNNLRRILEYYFKIIGNYDYEAIINHFDFEDKQTCKALISWINDGSHFINDDLLVETEIESVDRYLKVFKDIFEKLGHLSHYNMMMNRN